MKIDLEQPLLTLDGQAMLEPPAAQGEAPQATTLRRVLVAICLAQHQTDPQNKGLAYRLYTLAHTIQTAGETCEIENFDAVFLQDRAELLGYPPLTVGRLTDILNGRTSPVASTPQAVKRRVRV